jgi:hypothetical protein
MNSKDMGRSYRYSSFYFRGMKSDMSIASATRFQRRAPRFDNMANPFSGPIADQRDHDPAVGPNDRIAAFRSLEQIRQSSA